MLENKIFITMKQQINEIRRMQQLAGVLKEKFTKIDYRQLPNASVSVEIEMPQDIINVTFTGKVIVEPGALDYEYGGARGTYDPGDEAYVEDINWDRENFSDEENNEITNYIDENFEEIEKNLIQDFMGSKENDF